MISKFDNSLAPVLRYDFNGDLLDRSEGPAEPLTGAGAKFRQVYGTTLGLSAMALSRAVHDAELELYGDITVAVICILRSTPAGLYLVAFQASGETEPTNYLWSFQITSVDQFAYLSEHKASVSDPAHNDTHFSNGSIGLPAFGVPFICGMRRRAGVVSFFLGPDTYGDPSPPLPAPTGGTVDVLTLNTPGTGPADLIALQAIPAAISDADWKDLYNATMGPEFGLVEQAVRSLWVGALGTTTASVVVQLACASNGVRLVVDDGVAEVFTAEIATADHSRGVRFDLTGLDPDTAYFYRVQENGADLPGPVGNFRTAPSGASSFLVAFGGDAESGSNHQSFAAIRALSPLLFLHLGDTNYNNVATNDPKAFRANYDQLLASPRQAELYANVPTVPVWDDHDFAGNNCDGSAASKPAAAAVYRERVPHYPLPDATGIWQTFDIGRVRFIVTDQRSAASPDAATDNASKSILGPGQKLWFKDLLANSAGMLIVWVCPRWFGTPATAGADSWGGFSTERRELADYIKSNCHGRVVVLSADLHALGIDDGSNHDFATGGGEPLPTFQAAPLDITVPGGAGTFSEGGPFTNNGQFGTMEIQDAGGASLTVIWRGFDSTGTELASHTFTVAL